MSIPDPPWKLRTRPCPFYSQGRCLFSDSCNFLHDAKIKVKPTVYEATSVFDVPEYASSPPSIQVSRVCTPPPRVSLDRVSLDGAVESIRSPPRSPRLSSLLLALGNAIEPEEDQSWTENQPTYDEPEEVVHGRGQQEDERAGKVGVEDGDESVFLAYAEDDDEEDDVGAELHDRSATLVPSATFNEDEDEEHEITVTMPHSSSREEDEDTGKDESGLLSPIEIKLAGPRSMPLNSLSSMCRREDSIDSGYADNWTGPTPLAISPPHSERRFSTLSILSSPFGTPSSRVISPTFVPGPASGWPATTLFSAKSSVADSADIAGRQQETGVFMDDLDSPSDYHRRHSTSSHGSTKPVPDVEDTVKPPVATSLHDEGFDESISFDDEDSALVSDPEDTRHPHQAARVFSEPDIPQSIVSQPGRDVFGELDHDIPSEPVTQLPEQDMPAERITHLATFDSDVSSFLDETPVKKKPSHSPAALREDLYNLPTAVTTPIASGSDTTAASISFEEDSYIAAYTVGSSPDVDPDTSAEIVSSNAPSPFAQPVVEDATEDSEPASFYDPNDTALNLYDEYYSSVPVSPTGSYSFLAHHDAPITSTPPSRIPTPMSSSPAISLSSSRASIVPNFSAPFRQESSQSSQPSPSLSSVPSRPPSQLGSAGLRSLSPSPLSPAFQSSSPSPIERPSSSASSTKVPFGFRHSVQARPREQSISSVRTFGSASSVTTRHRPPALTGILRPGSGLSRSNSVGSSRTRDSHLLSPEPRVRSASPRRLKPLRLSLIFNSSSSLGSSSSAFPPSLTTATTASSHMTSSPTVSSDYSITNNGLLKSPRSSSIPDHNTQIAGQPRSAPASDSDYSRIPHPDSITRRQSWQHRLSQDSDTKQFPSRRSSLAHPLSFSRPSSRLSELVSLHEEEEVDFTGQDDDDVVADEQDDTIRRSIAEMQHPAAVPSRPPSVLLSPVHAIATPRPTLLFAIASDDVNEVKRVLESGEAGPNDDVGPQSALAFAVTANQLKHKQEIIKLLLAHGANPSVLTELPSAAPSRAVSPSGSQHGDETPAPGGLLETLDPATRYFISRAEAPQTRRASALIHRSFFRPLTKVRYDMIGQDRALEQLFRVLSMPSAAPIVVLLCGPSGHGKSLLARRFGSLLDVPTHTVNMTTLGSTHDIWRSYSMSPFEEPSASTLGDFLTENQGKRCVVVLDEIEKVEDQKYLSSLLMPWELGRCSFGAGQRHVDVSKVIWLGTSNIGHDLVFEHQTQRVEPTAAMSREEYVDLMGLLRPQVSDRLGPSLLSRVTTVLPFVPFSDEEKMAIAAEALQSLTGEETPTLPAATVEKLVRDALRGYVPAEGARSLHRAVSNLLLDTIY